MPFLIFAFRDSHAAGLAIFLRLSCRVKADRATARHHSFEIVRSSLRDALSVQMRVLALSLSDDFSLISTTALRADYTHSKPRVDNSHNTISRTRLHYDSTGTY